MIPLQTTADKYMDENLRNQKSFPFSRVLWTYPTKTEPETGVPGPFIGKNRTKTAAEIPRRSRATDLGPRYFVTRSSQRTIDSMTSIDRPQAPTKTAHVAHIGVWR